MNKTLKTALNPTSPVLRHADRFDAKAMTELVNYAGEGLPLYLWQKDGVTEDRAWEIGRQRALREEGSFSYRNAVMADIDGNESAGCLIGYGISDTAAPMPDDIPYMFRPLLELENEAAGSWYVNVLAVYPAFRGMGLGTRLLKTAERIAADTGHRSLSIIVSDGNPGARRLYERCGYRVAAQRPMVKEGWRNNGKNWILMLKAM